MSSGKVRWRCAGCGHSFIRKRPDKKTSNEHVWFKLWVDGNYTVKQLTRNSGYSRSKLRHILLRELATTPPIKTNLALFTHIIFDGKYLFGRKFCLLVILDALSHRPIAGTVVKAENRKHLLPWLQLLKNQGLSPVAVTTDGKQTAIYAFKDLWPDVITQRCLFHIKLQVEAWLREKPRYASTRALLSLTGVICNIENIAQANTFKKNYSALEDVHQKEIEGFDRTHPVQGDAIRSFSLVTLALCNCFHYLNDPRIAKTTSSLEGYFKQVQRIRGFSHNGLTQEHLFHFIAWKLYYDNE